MNKKEFAIKEFFIIIGVIIILVVAMVSSFDKSPSQERDAVREGHIKSINSAMLLYQNEMNDFDDLGISDKVLEICNIDLEDCTGLADLSDLYPEYITSLPIDPKGGIKENGTGYFIRKEPMGIVAARAESREVAIGICPPVADLDGRVYETVQIGNQCWMAENLAYLPEIPSPAETGSPNKPFYYVYGYNKENSIEEAKASDNYKRYGVLYNWPAAVDANIIDLTEDQIKERFEGKQGVCPNGWHLPTDEEWAALEAKIDSEYDYDYFIDNIGWRGKDVGAKLKVETEEYENKWNDRREYNCDSEGSAYLCSGFNGVPAGCRHTVGSFRGLDYYAHWWSSSSPSSSETWRRCLYRERAVVNRWGGDRGRGCSLRCIQD